MNQTFTGVVIKEAPNGENGKLLWVLTEQRGVVCMVATGAKKLTASYLKSVQLFAYSRLTVYEKNGHMTLTEAELIEGFYYIRKDLVALAFASYACEMARIAAVPEDSSMLRLLLNTLYALSKELAPTRLIKAVFELKLCCVSGLMPDVNCECTVCSAPSDGYNITELEPRCHEHCGKTSDFVTLCTSTKKLISYVCSADFARMLSFRASSDTVDEFCLFCEAFAVAALEINPKTLQFYNEISRKQL
jgi:DNA repair protein recO